MFLKSMCSLLFCIKKKRKKKQRDPDLLAWHRRERNKYIKKKTCESH